MAWSTSRRKQTLPPDWPKIRVAIGTRDNWSCQWRVGGGLCGARATQCDHIIPGGPDTESNLQMLCDDHHARKSSSEGGRAKAIRVAQTKKKIARPAEEHPTLPPPATKPPIPGM